MNDGKKREEREVGSRTPLNRTEAQWVVNWLIDCGATVKGGWYAVYQMTPFDISKKFKVSVEDVIAAAEGKKR